LCLRLIAINANQQPIIAVRALTKE
jgi:hypothetical protein